MNWLTTSGGVTTAAMINAPTTTYPRASLSFSTVTMPMRTTRTTATGTSKVTPKARNMVMTKLR